MATETDIPVGDTGLVLRAVQRAAGRLDEAVVLADGETGLLAKIRTDAPAADDPGLVVRLIGNVTLGSSVEISNDSGNPIPVGGTVALDAPSLAALETIQIGNFAASFGRGWTLSQATDGVTAFQGGAWAISNTTFGAAQSGVWNVGITGAVAVTGTFFQPTQPVSIAATVAVNDPGLPDTLGQKNAAGSTSVIGSSEDPLRTEMALLATKLDTLIAASSGGGGVEDRANFASGAGPFTLPHAWNGKKLYVFFDGILQADGALVGSNGSATLTLGGGVNPSFFNTIAVIYTY